MAPSVQGGGIDFYTVCGTSYPTVSEARCPAVQRHGCEAGHSHPIAEDINPRSYTFTAPHTSIKRYLTKYIDSFISVLHH